ncbi:hypothetical protein FB451DRAFT_1171919 [Mycena latifolia]|nr:hypothetical protein FB451DRAFT_1171919 [Mycena latifolia]
MNVSLTCTTLSGAALDELWWALEGLSPLLKLLPSLKLRAGTYTLTRSPNDKEWAKFDQYACRIHVIELNDQETVPIDMIIYERLEKEHKTPLLSRLQKLICTPLTDKALISLPHSLHYIRFESDDNIKTLKFLLHVSSTLPELKTLRADLKHCVGSPVYKIIETFGGLRNLRLDLQDSSLREYIGFDTALAQSQLVTLSITAPTRWEKDIHKHSFVSGFENLHEFAIQGGFGVIGTAMSRIQASSLSELQIVHAAAGDGSRQDWKPLIGLIFRRWSVSLQVIFLDLSNSSPPVSFNSLFGSLDNLPNLREFHLSGYSPIKITDNDVLTLAKKCTGIEQLTLISGNETKNMAPTIQSLVHLSNHCPRLMAIQISLAPAINLPLNISSSFHRQKALRILYIRGMLLSPDPQVAKTHAVARYLDQIFSRLEYIKHWSLFPDPGWMQVELLVLMFQAVRAEKLVPKNYCVGCKRISSRS